MKNTSFKHLHTLVALAAIAFAFALPASALAQVNPSQPQSEAEVNDDYHAFILMRLQKEVMQRENLMNKQAQQILINLPNEQKLYDETFVKIHTGVEEGTKEDGTPEINFVYSIEYSCHHFEGTEDDYPSAAYVWNSSNSCRAICNLTKTMLEGTCADYFKAGRNVTVEVTSTTDAAEIAHINYRGEYGDFRYMPAIFNDEHVRLSVDAKDGITTNAQLAYIRAQSVKDFVENNIAPLKRTANDYQFVTRCFDMTGPHYRRSSLKIVVHGAFDAQAEALAAGLRNDEYVDFNIPRNQENANSRTYALIIAEEEYTAPLPNCDYAANDGDVMREYFVKTLGIPTRHVKVLHNAGRKEIYDEGISWLKDIIFAQRDTAGVGQVHIILYYAGHGISNAKFAPILVPSDVDVSKMRAFRSKTGELPDKINLKGGDAEKIIKQCIPLDTLTGWFNRINALSYTFIIDASFDGVQRSGKNFFNIQKETKKFRAPRVRSDIVLFLAAAGDKTAYSFIDQHHGFFTYYILRELKYTKGDITFEDLFNNVSKNQAYESSLQNKLQEPIYIIGGKLGEGWGNRTFLNN